MVILAINSVLGCLGNLVVMIVNGQKRSKNSTDIFILELSCIDFLVSAFYMPTSLFELLTNVQSSVMCAIDKGGAFIYVTASYIMFFCIAVDRLIAVIKPHEYTTIMRPRRAMLLGVLAVILGCLISTPIIMSCFTQDTFDDKDHIINFHRMYSASVIFLSLFLAGEFCSNL